MLKYNRCYTLTDELKRRRMSFSCAKRETEFIYNHIILAKDHNKRKIITDPLISSTCLTVYIISFNEHKNMHVHNLFQSIGKRQVTLIRITYLD